MWASVALIDVTKTLFVFIANNSQQLDISQGPAGLVLRWIILSLGEPRTVLEQSSMCSQVSAYSSRTIASGVQRIVVVRTTYGNRRRKWQDTLPPRNFGH